MVTKYKVSVTPNSFGGKGYHCPSPFTHIGRHCLPTLSTQIKQYFRKQWNNNPLGRESKEHTARNVSTTKDPRNGPGKMWLESWVVIWIFVYSLSSAHHIQTHITLIRQVTIKSLFCIDLWYKSPYLTQVNYWNSCSLFLPCSQVKWDMVTPKESSMFSDQAKKEFSKGKLNYYQKETVLVFWECIDYNYIS